MFHFSWYPRTRSPWIATRLNIAPGFPIRTSPDQRLLATSPKLIAGCYVLHRLFVSRHPPHALMSLSLPLKHEDVLRLCSRTVARPCIQLSYLDVKTWITHLHWMNFQDARLAASWTYPEEAWPHKRKRVVQDSTQACQQATTVFRF